MVDITSNDLRLCERVLRTLTDKYHSYSKTTEVLTQSISNIQNPTKPPTHTEGIILRKSIEIAMKEMLDDFTKFVENLKIIHELPNT